MDFIKGRKKNLKRSHFEELGVVGFSWCLDVLYENQR
jgi:hypothetical protein